MTQIFWVVFFTCIAWLILMFTLKNPAFLQNIYIPLSQAGQNYQHCLENTIGVKEWYISGDTLIVKFDAKASNGQDILYSLNNDFESRVKIV
jgi:hypothetical protein